MNKLRPRHHRRVGDRESFSIVPGKEGRKLLFSPPQFGSGERNETGCSLALKNSTEESRILILSVLLCLIMRGCPNCFGGMNAAAGVVRRAALWRFAQSRISKFIDCRQNFGATFSPKRRRRGRQRKSDSCYANCSALLSLFEDGRRGAALSVRCFSTGSISRMTSQGFNNATVHHDFLNVKSCFLPIHEGVPNH